MAWVGSTRRDRLPRDWHRRRVVVLRRAGYQCEWVRYDTESRCGQRATDVDHIERGDVHELDNLQALCRWHHQRKSSREGGEASRGRKPKRSREAESHPGVGR